MSETIPCEKCGSEHPSHICIDLETTPKDVSHKVLDVLMDSGIKNIKVWRQGRFLYDLDKPRRKRK